MTAVPAFVALRADKGERHAHPLCECSPAAATFDRKLLMAETLTA